MVPQWRFILPAVMLLFFAASLGYVAVRGCTSRTEYVNGWGPVSVWDGDAIEDGLRAFQTVGLLPAALLLSSLTTSIDGWWIYLADIVSISCVWFVIGLVIDRIKRRSKLEPLQLR